MAHQPKVHFVPFSCASSSGNEVEILGFLKTHRSVIIGRFKPRKSRKGRREDKKRGREGKGQKLTSKTMNRGERNVTRKLHKKSGKEEEIQRIRVGSILDPRPKNNINSAQIAATQARGPNSPRSSSFCNLRINQQTNSGTRIGYL